MIAIDSPWAGGAGQVRAGIHMVGWLWEFDATVLAHRPLMLRAGSAFPCPGWRHTCEGQGQGPPEQNPVVVARKCPLSAPKLCSSLWRLMTLADYYLGSNAVSQHPCWNRVPRRQGRSLGSRHGCRCVQGELMTVSKHLLSSHHSRDSETLLSFQILPI
jgi:hypothetical protein